MVTIVDCYTRVKSKFSLPFCCIPKNRTGNGEKSSPTFPLATQSGDLTSNVNMANNSDSDVEMIVDEEETQEEPELNEEQYVLGLI